MRSALVLLALLLLPTSALAQRAIPIYLDGGATFPGGDYGKTWTTGFNVGAGAAFPLRPRLAIRADLGLNRFELDKEALFEDAGLPPGMPGVEIVDGELSTFSALALLQWDLVRPELRSRPYLLGGVGYRRIVAEDVLIRGPAGEITVEGGAEDGAAAALGAGISFALRPTLRIFAEGGYLIGWDVSDAPSVDERYVPLKVGVAFVP